ncbi:MAG: hypothetical protein AAF743_02185 [Planctomycetota bacterium]
METCNPIIVSDVPRGLDVALDPANPALARTPIIHSVLLLEQATALSRATGRSTMLLPIDRNLRVLDLWREWTGITTEPAAPSLRILAGWNAPTPDDAEAHGETDGVAIMRDSNAYRGTGGALADGTRDLPDEAWVLVAWPSIPPLIPFKQIEALVARECAGADAAVLPQPQGPALTLIRRSVLATVADEGYIDLKEQVLPHVGPSRALRLRRPKMHEPHRRGELFPAGGLPIRTFEQYLQRLLAYHRPRAGSRPAVTDTATPTAVDVTQRVAPGSAEQSHNAWRPCFTLPEAAARIAASADVYDTVVLGGGVIERNAVVARSLVCPGAVVPEGAHLVNRLVLAEPEGVNRNAIAWLAQHRQLSPLRSTVRKGLRRTVRTFAARAN